MSNFKCCSHCGCPPTGNDKPSIFSQLAEKTSSLIAGIVYGNRRFNYQEVKVAFIGNYNANCGISTYNEELVSAILNSQSNDKRKFNLKVFAEYHEDDKLIEDDLVVRCWSRKEHPKLKLIKAVLDFAPDIVHISHEYGLFPSAYQFTSLVSMFKSKGIKVIATMHSVYEHDDKLVSENAPDYIIVHTESAKQCLLKKGIAKYKIEVIPHGSPIFRYENKQPALLTKDWNTWQSNHTIFQAGFLFEYKGHARMLKIVAKLKEKYPDVHYIIQGSENDKYIDEHNKIYAGLVALAKELDIESNITINRGFVSEPMLISHIRTVTCCVLPYVASPEHDVRATSGIARLIVSTETPLIVSDVHLFDDVKNVVTSVSTDDDFYNAIDNVFQNKGVLSAVEKEKRIGFLGKTSWENVGYNVKDYYLITSLK